MIRLICLIYCIKLQIFNDTIPSYRIDNLTERYNETLLKKTELTMKEKKTVIKALNLTETRMPLPISAHPNHFIR